MIPQPTPKSGPNPIDLTTVAYLQQYLAMGPGGSGGGGNPVTGNTSLQQSLVTAASKTAITQIGRNPFVQTYNELYDGTGTQLLVLRNWPIVSVSLVQIFGAFGPLWPAASGYQNQPIFPVQPLVIPQSVPTGQPGYVFEPGAGTIRLVGSSYTFTYGSRNVNVVYIAGFSETFPENQTITGGTVKLNQAATWLANVSVVYALGASAGQALTLVASSPIQGQYTVSATGVYGFSSADEAELVTVTYQFGQPPYDLQDAVCEIAAVEYRRLQHIDQDSQGMVEATTGFTRLPIPRLAALRLEQYKNKLPAQ